MICIVKFPRGPLVFEVGYHHRKKKLSQLESFFRPRQCMSVHRIGGLKHSKLEKKIFLFMLTNFGKDIT